MFESRCRSITCPKLLASWMLDVQLHPPSPGCKSATVCIPMDLGSLEPQAESFVICFRPLRDTFAISTSNSSSWKRTFRGRLSAQDSRIRGYLEAQHPAFMMSWYTRPLCGLRSPSKVIDTRSTLSKAYGSRTISRLTHHNRTTGITKPATILSPSDGVETKRWEHGSRSIPSQKRASSTYTNIGELQQRA